MEDFAMKARNWNSISDRNKKIFPFFLTFSNQEVHSLKQSALKMERDHGPVDPKIVGERKPPGGRGSYCAVLHEGEH